MMVWGPPAIIAVPCPPRPSARPHPAPALNAPRAVMICYWQLQRQHPDLPGRGGGGQGPHRRPVLWKGSVSQGAGLSPLCPGQVFILSLQGWWWCQWWCRYSRWGRRGSQGTLGPQSGQASRRGHLRPIERGARCRPHRSVCWSYQCSVLPMGESTVLLLGARGECTVSYCPIF